ncbi:MAG: hypothetical protein LQ346_006784 [Caloplaca aetnensis]|nr:MAG: hypothetical protein LQ346_006784 [Caloplaca aetnensis]
MEKEAFEASQEDGRPNTFTAPVEESENPSSPLHVTKSSGKKQKARPTVTPRTFTRFFTPRTSLTRGSRIGASRQALRDITASAAANRNLNGRRRSPKPDSIVLYENEEGNGSSIQPRKKRKTEPPAYTTITPNASSPLNHVSARLDEVPRSSHVDLNSGLDDDNTDSEQDVASAVVQQAKPIVRTQNSTVARLLSRELGLGIPKQHLFPACNGSVWQEQTANFYSNPRDSHVCDNPIDPSKSTLPFCSMSCNTNSLVAVGDEEGGIRLLETSPTGKPQFCKTYLSFRPHTNAIMDLAFSQDDMLLATAAGDQSSQVIDMPNQQGIYTFAAHEATVKQIKFQPGSSNVIATSSRDGSVRFWDLRCKGSDGPVRDLRISLDGPVEGQTSRSAAKKMTYGRCVDSIIDAHLYRGHPSLAVSQATFADETYDMPTKNQTSTKYGYHSVTSLAFLPPGREHLLLTASEANASVRLWDIRTTHSHRRSTDAVPVSSTRQPDSHAQHRTFGITSLALSGDSARLYAYCRDNTVYAYSINHLVLGNAPELSTISPANNTTASIRKSRFSRTTEKEGLGPIFGFRHPQFHATSFYVKIAIRPAKDGGPELLAAGSSDGCAVLWPTDERYLRSSNSRIRDVASKPTTPSATVTRNPYATPPSSAPWTRPLLPQTTSHARLNDTIPIYTHGTPLIRGHDREVTGLSWAYGGELVTVSDDCTARCWREDQERARDLRVGGEGEGRRWDCGWADVPEEWDEE